MKNRDFDIFREDVTLPDAVNEKMDAAFRRIRENPDRNLKTIIRLKRTAAAAACAALLAAGVITAAAAAYTQWNRGMNGALPASPQQQKELEENGAAVVLNTGTDGTASETDAAENAALLPKAAPVTDNGVTVCPRMTVTTRDNVWISFSVDGFVPEAGAQPGFGTVDVQFGDELENGASWINIQNSFYDGIISDANGHPVCEDGSAPADGSFEPAYADENGTLEFVIQISADTDTGFLGQSLHIRLQDLGTLAKASFSKSLEGTWEFTIPLSDSDAYQSFTASSAIGDTGITIRRLEISPVSIRAALSIPEGSHIDGEFITNMTFPCGVRYKDGTMLTAISDGGGGGFTDETRTEYRIRYPFCRVIDPQQIDALIFRNPSAGNGEDPLYIIPLE